MSVLVKDRMTPNPITITKQTTIANALQVMRQNKIRRLPVMEGENVVGIVTDRDLSEVSPSPATSLSIFELNYLLAKSKIGDIMKNQKLITIGPNAFIEEAALLMREHKIGGIPVVENGKLIGIITETNIFEAFIDIMGLRQKGYRITVKLGTFDRPGVLAELTQSIADNKGNITHMATYYDSSEIARDVIRINQGDIEAIMNAIKALGHEASYIQTNG